jgi:hypothetical protein
VFKRGFKSWCETTSLLLRKRVGLQPLDPLDAWNLSAHLGIEIWSPVDIPNFDSKYLAVLVEEDPESWSAITISSGSKDVIILNPTHKGGRPASDLMHELSHIVIGHIASRIDISEDGLLLLSTFDPNQEDEAKWLCGSLLLPRPALLLIRRMKWDLKVAAKKYGTSEQMVRFRMNVLGLTKRNPSHK